MLIFRHGDTEPQRITGDFNSVFSVTLCGLFLFTHHLPHQPQHFSWLGMTVRGQFRIQQLSIDSHFELPAIRRDQFDLFDQMLIVLEQFIYQAHGPTGVVSDRAVNDLDVQHSPSANFREIISLRQLVQKRGDRLIGRRGFDLLRRPHLAQHPSHDHGNAMTQLGGFLQIVGDKDGRAMIAA